MDDEDWEEWDRLQALRDKLIMVCDRLWSEEADPRATNPLGPGEFLTLAAWARLTGISPRTAYEFRQRWSGRGFPVPRVEQRGIAYYDWVGLDLWYERHRRERSPGEKAGGGEPRM